MDEIERIKQLAEKATPAPWRWNVNLKSRSISIESTGVPMLETVMDFARWGMNGARPRFVIRDERIGPILHDAEEFAVPVPGREHHADWYSTLDHPDAALIVALRNAWPTLLARIEAGEKLAEAAERFIDNNCESCMGEICHRCREARAALAAFAAAKEAPNV